MKNLYHKISEDTALSVMLYGGSTATSLAYAFLLREPGFLIPAGITAIIGLIVYIKD